MAIVNKSKKETKKFVQQNTTWKNNLKVSQSFVLYPPGNPQQKGYEPLEVHFEPGEELEIPSEYDSIIHQVRVDKKTKKETVVGGLAPQLTKIGSKAKLHPSLDVELQDRKFQMENLVKKKIEQQVMAELLKEKAEDIK